jgi:nitroreductase
MEFKQAVGRYRTFQHFLPWRPVERSKIQVVLEAARLSSRAVNVAFAKAIVAHRTALTSAERDALKSPASAALFDVAPVYIFWYLDMDARRKAIEEKKWPTVASGALVDVGAIGPPHGWSHRYVQEVVLPEVLMPGLEAGIQRGGNPDAGLAMAQGLLAAYDEGLAACLAPFNESGAREVLHAPDTWEPVTVMFLGYPGESWAAAGQEPRKPFEEVFFEQCIDRPFPRDPEVIAGLKRDGLIQDENRPPWRSQEVRALGRMLAAYLDGHRALEED